MMLKKSIPLLLAAAALLFGPSRPAGAAQAGSAPELSPDSSMQAVVAGIAGAALSLQEAMDEAARNSVTARSAAAALDAALGIARRERGGFDPVLSGALSHAGNTLPSTSPFQGADILRTETTTGSAGVGVLLPTGGQLSASFNATRSETNSGFATLNPQTNASGSLSLVQPLLKGFGPAARGTRGAAEFELEASRNSYESAISAVRAVAEQTYWALYAAERTYAAQRLARDQAAAFLTQTGLRATVGRGGPSQVASARVFLAEQEQALLDREEAMDAVSDQLASLMGRRPAEGTNRFLVTTEPGRDFAVEDEDTLVGRAIRRNRSLRAAERSLAAVAARVRASRWQALPQLDFVGSIGGNGISGTGKDIVFGGDTLRNSVRGGLSDAWSQVHGRRYPSWNYGLVLSVPLGFRRTDGERQRADAELAQAEQGYRAVRLQLEERVRAARRELLHASERLKSARSGVDAALEQVRIGQLEYNAGLKTAYELVRLRADLATAQQRYSQALVRAATAEAALRHLVPDNDPTDE